jgi:glycosyltransferase involved in cell wall biosynthesis
MKNPILEVRRLAGRAKRFARQVVVRGYVKMRLPKVVTAMIRVKNEEQFLLAAVASIVDHVDRIVIIDNQSIDRTPRIISDLVSSYPGKITGCSYDHSIYRVGKENAAAAAANKNDPRLLSNYYNFCLEQCRTRYVLKWDGDMIATKMFGYELRDFRNSKSMILSFRGANLHPNRTTLIAPRRDENGKWDVLDNWTDEFTDPEPRIFPKFMAGYDTGFSWCEKLITPFLDDFKWTRLVEKPVYAHMKYCKEDPYANMSTEFATDVQRRIREGRPLDNELSESLAWIANSPFTQTNFVRSK